MIGDAEASGIDKYLKLNNEDHLNNLTLAEILHPTWDDKDREGWFKVHGRKLTKKDIERVQTANFSIPRT